VFVAGHACQSDRVAPPGSGEPETGKVAIS
jgi:hypothetical protein